mmetsp:Transcript_24001/g.71424  ORF Transcript_24001/g.71424 Transcript_24001/m.71424 type:complete len:250 (+) Transcript_24001:598-1347(+)
MPLSPILLELRFSSRTLGAERRRRATAAAPTSPRSHSIILTNCSLADHGRTKPQAAAHPPSPTGILRSESSCGLSLSGPRWTETDSVCPPGRCKPELTWELLSMESSSTSACEVMAKASATAQSEAGLQPAGSRSRMLCSLPTRSADAASRKWQRWRPRFRRWAKEISVASLARRQSTSRLSSTLGCWSRSSERSSRCAAFSSFSAQRESRGFATGLPETDASALSVLAAATSAREAFSMSEGWRLPAF